MTLRTLTPNYVVHLGGVVAVHAVKLLKNSENTKEESDGWWTELRQEIKSHAQYLGCQNVIGYSETTTVFDNLIVLSGVGSAVELELNPSATSPVSNETSNAAAKSKTTKRVAPNLPFSKDNSVCSFCHIPSHGSVPFKMKMTICLLCKKKSVPEILLTTLEPPADLPILGVGRLIEARVCKLKKSLEGEANAIGVSDSIPFLEYDLHQQLIQKLKVYSMNAIFSLSFQITVGDSMIVGLASGTAVFLPALPSPPLPLPSSLDPNQNLNPKNKNDKKFLEIQQKLTKFAESNKQNLSKSSCVLYPDITSKISPAPLQEMKLNAEEKVKESPESLMRPNDSSSALSEAATQSFLVDIEDELDIESLSALLEPDLSSDYPICTTEVLPGYALPSTSILQMITAIRRVELDLKEKKLNQLFSSIFQTLLLNILFKLRTQGDQFCLSNLRSNIQIADENSLEIILSAVVVSFVKVPLLRLFFINMRSFFIIFQ